MLGNDKTNELILLANQEILSSNEKNGGMFAASRRQWKKMETRVKVESKNVRARALCATWTNFDESYFASQRNTKIETTN